MSAAKMGEYLDATAHRRERILKDQKFPPNYKSTTYKDAYEVSRRAVVGGGEVVDSLFAAASKLREKSPKSPSDATAIACSVAAVERFGGLYPRLGLRGVEATFVGPRGLTQRIEEVSISAYPLVLLKDEVRGVDRTGALLLVFRMEEALTKRGGSAAADLLRGALAQSGLVNPLSVRPEFCIVVDVFHDNVYHAPRSRKRLSAEIESACREIAILWPAVGRRAA